MRLGTYIKRVAAAVAFLALLSMWPMAVMADAATVRLRKRMQPRNAAMAGAALSITMAAATLGTIILASRAVPLWWGRPETEPETETRSTSAVNHSLICFAKDLTIEFVQLMKDLARTIGSLCRFLSTASRMAAAYPTCTLATILLLTVASAL